MTPTPTSHLARRAIPPGTILGHLDGPMVVEQHLPDGVRTWSPVRGWETWPTEDLTRYPRMGHPQWDDVTASLAHARAVLEEHAHPRRFLLWWLLLDHVRPTGAGAGAELR